MKLYVYNESLCYLCLDLITAYYTSICGSLVCIWSLTQQVLKRYESG